MENIIANSKEMIKRKSLTDQHALKYFMLKIYSSSKRHFLPEGGSKPKFMRGINVGS